MKMNIFSIIVINLSFVIGELDFAVHVKGEKQMILSCSTSKQFISRGFFGRRFSSCQTSYGKYGGNNPRFKLLFITVIHWFSIFNKFIQSETHSGLTRIVVEREAYEIWKVFLTQTRMWTGRNTSLLKSG